MQLISHADTRACGGKGEAPSKPEVVKPHAEHGQPWSLLRSVTFLTSIGYDSLGPGGEGSDSELGVLSTATTVVLCRQQVDSCGVRI